MNREGEGSGRRRDACDASLTGREGRGAILVSYWHIRHVCVSECESERERVRARRPRALPTGTSVVCMAVI